MKTTRIFEKQTRIFAFETNRIKFECIDTSQITRLLSTNMTKIERKKYLGLKGARETSQNPSFRCFASAFFISFPFSPWFLVSAGNETSSRQHRRWGQRAANGPRCRVMLRYTRHCAPAVFLFHSARFLFAAHGA